MCIYVYTSFLARQSHINVPLALVSCPPADVNITGL